MKLLYKSCKSNIMKRINTALILLLITLVSACCNKKTDAVYIFDEIVAANEKFMEAFSNQDAAAMTNLYTADAQLMPPFSGFVEGSEAIEAACNEMFAGGLTDIKLETLEAQGNEDMAWEVGTYTIFAGSSFVDQGKYIVIWKNVDGSWKLYRDIYNSSVPLPSMEEPMEVE